MAISRHKVLSEMQQQLELASSKCGNLQKQLEIVKDKVRQSSTTNLMQMEPLDEKKNKVKNGQMQDSSIETERSQEYQQAVSLSSSSTEDVNDERDVNIIKVFYDRLGQMDYPKGHVELSDISSEENDFDIDQLLSSVNFSIVNNEKAENKRKEKRCDKKVKEKSDKSFQKRKKSKTKGPSVNPYESHLMKPLKPSPVKLKNRKNKQKLVRSAVESGMGSITGKPISRGTPSKCEMDRQKKKRQTIINSSVLSKNGKSVFQEPIKRIMNIAGELRKTKSSTGAEKKEMFTDSRSLTRLHTDALPGLEKAMNKSNSDIQDAKFLQLPQAGSGDNDGQGRTENARSVLMHGGKLGVVLNKGVVRLNRVDTVKKKEETKLKIPATPAVTQMKDKGTSLSDLNKMTMSNKLQKTNKVHDDVLPTWTTPNKTLDTPKTVQIPKNDHLQSTQVFKNIPATESKGRNMVSKMANFVEKKVNEFKPQVTKSYMMKPMLPENRGIESELEINRVKNGLLPHAVAAHGERLGKSDVKRKVNLFENSAPKNAMATDSFKKEVAREKLLPKPKGTPLTITRTNSKGTFYDDVSRRGQEDTRPVSSVVNNLPQPMYSQCTDSRDKEMAEINPLTISQIRMMKDNLMKFNAIPFIVGQSTTKSYHIGLNIQQTYSLFKQTPSMTALKVSKFADIDHHSTQSRARSIRTAFTGRTLSSVRGGMCPACGPAPDPSPEQLADPWAVPQDEEGAVIRVCTCLPKRIISFDQVLDQLYFTDMNLKLHPSLLSNKDGISKETELAEVKDKTGTIPHRGTNTLHYTKLLRSIQNLKDNILG